MRIKFWYGYHLCYHKPAVGIALDERELLVTPRNMVAYSEDEKWIIVLFAATPIFP